MSWWCSEQDDHLTRSSKRAAQQNDLRDDMDNEKREVNALFAAWKSWQWQQ